MLTTDGKTLAAARLVGRETLPSVGSVSALTTPALHWADDKAAGGCGGGGSSGGRAHSCANGCGRCANGGGKGPGTPGHLDDLDTLERAFCVTGLSGDWGVSVARWEALPASANGGGGGLAAAGSCAGLGVDLFRLHPSSGEAQGPWRAQARAAEVKGFLAQNP